MPSLDGIGGLVFFVLVILPVIIIGDIIAPNRNR